MASKIVEAKTGGDKDPKKILIRRASQIEEGRLHGVRYVVDRCPGGDGIAPIKTYSFSNPIIALHHHETASGKVACSHGGVEIILSEGVKLDF